jgi:hypothetical protein
MGGAVIQIMGKCQYAHTEHGIKHLSSVMPVLVPERDRSDHDSQSQTADRRWHHITMIQNTATEGEQAERNRDSQTDFMNQRVEQHAARRGKDGDYSNCRDAVDKTQAGHEHGHTIPQAIPDQKTIFVPQFCCRKHDSLSHLLLAYERYREMRVKIQHNIFEVCGFFRPGSPFPVVRHRF